MKTTFLERMQEYLKDEYEEYVKTLDQAMYKGLMINTAKCSQQFVKQYFPYDLTSSKFSPNGFLFDPNLKVGNHWTHLAGLYYLQEPSASAAVEALDVQKDHWVFDCCAAPGGKSHQIACALNHTGFLLSNEIDGKRANTLMSNLERLGVGENMITCSSLEKLIPQVKGWFDRVLVDAPCSGEGMMKKHEIASIEWSKENNIACSIRQKHLLDLAVLALKKDGILVYSTCTYAIEENEAVIFDFLKKHPEMELLDANHGKMRCGIPYEDLEVKKLIRIYPMDGGEGHFIAKMRKKEETAKSPIKRIKPKKIPQEAIRFLQDQIDLDMNLTEINSKIYMRKNDFIQLDVPILREGILAGEIIKNRFAPHHHFYMSSLLSHHYQHVIDLNDEQLKQYLSGNVIMSPKKGYVSCQYHGISLGFGKGDGNMIKNHYPKGLRNSQTI